MRKKLPLLPVLFLLAAVSCKKSNTSTGTTLSGTWDFVGLVAHTTAAVDQVYGSDDYKDVTVSDYTTTNNGGTITFNGGVAKTSDFTCEANFIAVDSSYLDGQLVGVVSEPFDVNFPATSGSSKYQQIGSDSLYFPSGGVFTMGASANTQTNAVGSRFTIHNDTLTLIVNFHQVSTQNIGGVPATQTNDVAEKVYYKKE
ncbi:MAG TPA: hypothetical protein VN616_08040 [Puia sp.]|nr:hypothetical protein [Puia sp.]